MQTSRIPIAIVAMLLIGAGCVNPVAERPSTPAADTPPQARVYSDAEACSMAVADDTEELPVMQRFAHLKTVGAVLTAHQCGTARLETLFGGEEAMFLAASRIILAADATAADRAALERIGYRCEDGATPCKRFIARRSIIVSDLLGLAALAPRIASEDCLTCGALATKTYTNTDAKLTFDYPVAWGEVRISRELAGIDAGKRVGITFSANDKVSLTAVTSDFSEGVGEGTPMYFTLRPGTRDLPSARSAAAALVQPFTIVSWERIGDGIYRMTHDAARYGGDVRMVSYLFTGRSGSDFSTLMVNSTADDDIRSDVEALVRSIR